MTTDPILNRYLKKMSFYGDIIAKPMFGGYGVYFEGRMFALFAEGVLYFKVDKANKEEFIKKKQKPFVYYGKPNQIIEMSYFTIPKTAWSSPKALSLWIQSSVDASLRNAQRKKGKT
ncbi:TfoX N-terminal domain protein [Leptospira ryugenii]|uniref:TfoX N-terminal domain protein n=1 Tax=Leptospira ryugenii TaxID=1917863 RepID=A0A2P2E1J9_9LEPT|nr:TfoX/Sxy family protein [Leptospira ryugenii]GBF50768.1 TfoX N-terminal domain protein [Leptospira ryugenii]